MRYSEQAKAFYQKAEKESIIDHLELAWKRVGQSSGDLDMPDPIAHADIEVAWPAFRDELISKIQSGQIGLSHVEIVDLPKDRLTVRPLARLELADRLIYEASVFTAAEGINAITPHTVYSYRWWRRERRILGPNSLWIRMQAHARRHHDRHPELLLARTDITSFYEHVRIDTLLEDLASVSSPNSWGFKTASRFLHSFNEMGNIWGIPQGYDASGLLANLYLVSLDNDIRREGFRHFRYSDDLYIFGDDWLNLRQILLKVNQTVRHRGLSLSGSKTEIVQPEDVKAVFEDAEKDAISYGVKVRARGSAKEVRKFFDRTVANDSSNTRDIKYSLTQLGILEDPHALEWTLSHLDELPHISREALVYLSIFYDDESTMPRRIADLLVSKKFSVYPYAEHHLIVFMIQQDVNSRRAVDACWKILLNRNKDGYLREMAARYLGIFSHGSIAARLKQEFQQESNLRLRRILLVACYEAKLCSDNFLKRIAQSEPRLELTARYLLSHPKRIPAPITERPQ